jgi:hypothetical protein
VKLPNILLISSLCLSGTVAGQEIDRLVGLPLLVSVPTAPIPVRADGKYRLAYELHVVNAASERVSLVRTEIRDSATLMTLDQLQLSKAIKPTGRASGQASTIIEPGMHVVIMLWLTLDHVPASLTHRLEGTVGGDPQRLIVESRLVTSKGRPVRLRPPLRGDRWIAIEGPSNDTHHRRSWFSYGGRALAPERFAIDFMRVCDDGALAKGDPADNHNWCGYGASAVAVADGQIAAVNDGVADNVPANRPPTPSTLGSISGNSVTLDLGEERYAHYLHLQAGSLRVKPGDHVRSGQVLGLVGNSGNANGTHLHFQVSDRPSFLFSDGLPYVFESFDHEDAESSGSPVHLSGRRSPRTDEIPLQNWVIDFH